MNTRKTQLKSDQPENRAISTRKTKLTWKWLSMALVFALVAVSFGNLAQTSSVSQFELGDAPDGPFPSFVVSNGIRHAVNHTIWLGPQVDYEFFSRIVDLDIFDDATYRFLTDQNGNPLFEVNVSGSPTSFTTAYLNVLVDFEGSCEIPDTLGWRQQSNHVVRDQRVTITPGQTTTVQVPATQLVARPSPHWIRITLTETPMPLASGQTWNGRSIAPFLTGETEDHCELKVEEPDLTGNPPLPELPSCDECIEELAVDRQLWQEANTFILAGNLEFNAQNQFMNRDYTQAFANFREGILTYQRSHDRIVDFLEKCRPYLTDEAYDDLSEQADNFQAWIDLRQVLFNDRQAAAVEYENGNITAGNALDTKAVADFREANKLIGDFWSLINELEDSLTTSCTTCATGIVSTEGPVDIYEPALPSVEEGVNESDNLAFLFKEQDELSGFTLSSSVTLDIPAGTTLPAGKAVSSYFLYFDPVGQPHGNQNSKTVTGSITFAEEVVGVIITDAALDATDGIVGSSTTTYPNSLFARGVESNTDVVNVVAPSTVTYSLTATTPGDSFRIITMCPAE